MLSRNAMPISKVAISITGGIIDYCRSKRSSGNCIINKYNMYNTC